MAKAKKGARGSDKLAAGLDSQRAKALQTAISGWKVIDWHDLGQPSTEMITARLSGSPGQVGSVVGKLVKLKEIRGIEILINGTPNPVLAEVRFKFRNPGSR